VARYHSSVPYRIEYSPDAVNHLRGLSASNQRMVVDAVEVSGGIGDAVGVKDRNVLRIGGQEFPL